MIPSDFLFSSADREFQPSFQLLDAIIHRQYDHAVGSVSKQSQTTYQ